MKKTGFKTIAVLVLVLTALVGLVLAGPGRGGRGSRSGPEEQGGFGMGMGRFGRPGEPGMQGMLGGTGEPGMLGIRRMLGELDLTDEQKKSVKQITEAAKEKRKTAAEAVREARKALWEAIVKGDETAARKTATNLGKVLGDQAVLKVQTTASIKAVLTPGQLKKLDELKTTTKERAGRFREKMYSPRFHKRFRGHRHKGDSWGPWGKHRGFGPCGREPNVGAPNEP